MSADDFIDTNVFVYHGFDETDSNESESKRLLPDIVGGQR